MDQRRNQPGDISDDAANIWEERLVRFLLDTNHNATRSEAVHGGDIISNVLIV